MKLKYQAVNNLKISDKLLSFVNEELLKNTNISPDKFWSGFDKAVHELAPRNKELIRFRDELQNKIDNWHLKNKGNKVDMLLLTATPIPRTMMLTVLGDISVSTIRKKPFNSKINTILKNEDNINQVISFLNKRIYLGEKVFWVCPKIR